MNRMGDFFSIMMMTNIKHDDDTDAEAAVTGLQAALADSLSTGPTDDLCAAALLSSAAARPAHLPALAQQRWLHLPAVVAHLPARVAGPGP